MDIKSKNCLVVGLGKSGLSAALLLKKLRTIVRVSDSSKAENLLSHIDILKSNGINQIETGKHSISILDSCKLVVVSPGIPMDNILIVRARELNVPVISEIELGYLYCKAPIVAITGTNGKTTTATLAADLLKNAGYKTYLCGNIGKAFCDIVLEAKSDDYIVLEASSFQLLTSYKFHPRVSMIINIDQDHLDYHKDFKEYYNAKAKIFNRQAESDYCILRQEDYDNYYSKMNIKPQIILVSQELKADIYVKGQNVFRNKQQLAELSEINLTNIKATENFLFLAALAQSLKISDEILFKTIRNFKGLAHRIENIGEFKGVIYIDDSKATNVSAARQALRVISQPIILLAGGLDKNTDFKAVSFDFLKNVKLIVLTGQARHKLKAALEGVKPLKVAESFREAIIYAKNQAVEGDVVLLSPMCASFDEFSSYKERGDTFKRIVKEINS
jgi:UDP-N-acetylmuramoylalanine--D-glutamate ligase